MYRNFPEFFCRICFRKFRNGLVGRSLHFFGWRTRFLAFIVLHILDRKESCES